MFWEDDHGAEARREFPDKTGIGGKPFDVSFVATVEEDGGKASRASPVLGTDKITLAKRGEVGEAEVVEPLLEVANLVLVQGGAADRLRG